MAFSELLAPLALIPDEYVVIDTETSGLFEGNKAPEPISLGLVRVIKEKAVSRHEFNIHSERPFTHNAGSVHSIPPSNVCRFPDLSESWPDICESINNQFVVAYNALFDWRVLVFAGQTKALPNVQPAGVFCAQRAAQPWAMANNIECSERGPSLDAISQYLDLGSNARHSALGDALLSYEVIVKLRAIYKLAPPYKLIDAGTATGVT